MAASTLALLTSSTTMTLTPAKYPSLSTSTPIACAGADAHWPGEDAALLVIAPVVALFALGLVAVLRRSAPPRETAVPVAALQMEQP